MILYKKEPFPLQMRNIMLLDDAESDGVVYVNKTTYDQALLLSGRMDGDPNRVLSLLTTPKTEAYRATPGLKNIVEKMMESMPKPLNMIAPFLIYCVQNQGIDWTQVDRVFAYGILHQFSQLTDFNAITLVPAEVRNNISVPTALLKSYEASWDDLCQSLRDLVTLVPTSAASQPVREIAPSPSVIVNQPTVTTQPTPAPAAVPTSVSAPAPVATPNGEESMEEKIARISAENRARTEAAKKAAAEAKKKQESITGGKPEVTPQQKQSSEEAAAANAVFDEFDV